MKVRDMTPHVAEEVGRSIDRRRHEMASAIPADLNQRLLRSQTAAALTEIGFKIAGPTLATMATRGGGPPFCKWGPRVVYRWGDALAWAEARLSKSRHTTSEADAQNADSE